MKVYVDRVPTNSDPSDGLSRKRLDEAGSLGWEIVEDPVIPCELFGAEF